MARGKFHPDNRITRNELCPCGSGIKFKKCCLHKVAAQPLVEPPPDLNRIAKAVGIKQGESYSLATVAARVEALARCLCHWYNADGSVDIFLPGDVIKKRQAAAKRMAVLEEVVALLRDTECECHMAPANCCTSHPSADHPDSWCWPCVVSNKLEELDHPKIDVDLSELDPTPGASPLKPSGGEEESDG